MAFLFFNEKSVKIFWTYFVNLDIVSNNIGHK